MDKVLVIGAGGRVGFPFCGYAASRGYDVYGYDRYAQAFINAESFVEQDATPGKFTRSTDVKDYKRWVAECDVIVIMIGTPVDAEGNPRTDGLTAIRSDIATALSDSDRDKDLLIVLRSTVSPGTTDVFRDQLEQAVYGKFKHDITVVFAPERIAQGKTYVEMPKIAQLIGAVDQNDFEIAAKFFSRLSPSVIQLTTKAAELGKLMTNMYRYVNFALANEMFMICDRHGQDFEQIRRAVNFDYPRMNLERAGPNAAGPCLKAGTPIMTPSGHVPIEKIQPGDIVFDRDSETIVTGISNRTVDISVTINVRGLELTSSYDHIHMVSDSFDAPTREIRAADIQAGQWVFIRRPEQEGILRVECGESPYNRSILWHKHIIITPLLARIIGLYLAEGHSGVYGNGQHKKPTATVCWSFGEHEEFLADEVVSCLAELGLKSHKSLKISKDATYGPSTCWHVRCRSVWLLHFLGIIGINGTANDKICGDFHSEIAPWVVGGWLDGDGCQSKGNIIGWSNSSALVIKMWESLAKIGVCAVIGSHGKSLSIATRDDVDFIVKYTNRFKTPDHYLRKNSYQSPTLRKTENGWMAAIKSITKVAESVEVFSIETESGRYIANHIETHNCLFKDGQFLVDHIPHVDLIKSSFSINEGMPNWIYWNCIDPLVNSYSMMGDSPVVGILGMAFKGNNDDTRYSLSYKMKKILDRQNLKYECYDGYLKEYNDPEVIRKCDVVIVMTPHKEFTSEFFEKYIKAGAMIVDIWKIFPESQDEQNGIYTAPAELELN